MPAVLVPAVDAAPKSKLIILICNDLRVFRFTLGLRVPNFLSPAESCVKINLSGGK